MLKIMFLFLKNAKFRLLIGSTFILKINDILSALMQNVYRIKRKSFVDLGQSGHTVT